MSRLRAALRLVCVCVLCIVYYAYLVTSTAVRSIVGRGQGRWRTEIFHGWARRMVRLLGVRIDVRGEPPAAPFFLVANHLSYVDVIVLASQVRCVFVAKAEVADWPIVGRLCASVDTLFIDRERKRDIPRVMRRIDAILAGGRGVVVFPEGTSSKGDGVLRFRPSLLELAVRSGRPVAYASLSYATPPGAPPAHLAVCWWGGMAFGKHVLRLLGLARIDAALVWGEKPIVEQDRKLLASRLHEAVERQFQPVI